MCAEAYPADDFEIRSLTFTELCRHGPMSEAHSGIDIFATQATHDLYAALELLGGARRACNRDIGRPRQPLRGFGIEEFEHALQLPRRLRLAVESVAPLLFRNCSVERFEIGSRLAASQYPYFDRGAVAPMNGSVVPVIADQHAIVAGDAVRGPIGIYELELGFALH